MKIVALDGYALNPGDLSWEAIERFGELTVYPRTSAEEVCLRAKDAEMLLINKVNITSKHLECLPNLKYIGIQATGYNVVDLEAAKQHGVIVCNIPAYSTASVAQMIFALLLAITNRVEHYNNENRNGRWSSNPDFCYWDTPLTELAEKKIGIVGLGNTGMATARIAQAFGMEVYAYTSKKQEQIGNIHKTDWEDLLHTCDIITLNCPLTPETKQIINRTSLEKMKRNAILINTGRGGLIHETELADALNNGVIAAYGADVLNEEPANADNPLLKAKNTFITPHIAWATKEARLRLMEISAANIRAFLDGKPQNVVNP